MSFAAELHASDKHLGSCVDALDIVVTTMRNALQNVDLEIMSGAQISRLVDLLVPLKHQLDGLVLASAARCVEVNQHNFDGASSGASWVASKTGTSEKQARVGLGVHKQLAELPDVREAVNSGKLSLEKASVITRAADGDEVMADSLLAIADQSVEFLQRRVQELKAPGLDREKLRKSQFVSIRQQDSMISGEFRLLPEIGLPLLEAFRKAAGGSGYERAESFAELLAEMGNNKKTEVVFHLDAENCELKGFGPVPVESAIEVFEEASFKLVGTRKNKLVWFSESGRRSSSNPLPEFVKRAVMAMAFDSCEASGCVSQADQVDHIQARCNQGNNDLSNLQALCEPHHHAKTKQDAPWTGGGIYGKRKLQQEEKLLDTG